MCNFVMATLTSCFNLTIAAHATLIYYGLSTKPPIQKFLSGALLCWGKYVAARNGIIYVGGTVRALQEDLDNMVPDICERIFDDWYNDNAGVLADNMSDNICDENEVEQVLHYLEEKLGVSFEDIVTTKRWWAMVDSSGNFIPLQVKSN